MLAQRCMGWHLTSLGESPSELAHRHEQRFLEHRERDDGGGKRTNVQGRPLDGTEICENGGVFLLGTSEAPRIFSWAFDKTFKR